MPVLTTDYVAQFQKDLHKIDQLEATPKLVRDTAVQALSNAAAQSIPHSSQVILNNAKSTLENIGTDSLASNFKTIYTQMCILAVSSLEATLKTYFSNAADAYTHLNMENEQLDRIKITLREVLENELRFGGKIGELILARAKPSFQDLRSIKETFKSYLNKEITLNSTMQKQLVFYLEARHVLVHKGGRVDNKFLRATATMNANLKDLTEGELVEIDAADWAKIKRSFTGLISEVTRQR